MSPAGSPCDPSLNRLGALYNKPWTTPVQFQQDCKPYIPLYIPFRRDLVTVLYAGYAPGFHFCFESLGDAAVGRAAPGGWRRAPSFSKAPESRVSLRCGFPKIRGTLLGVPIIRTMFGSPCFGKLPCRVQGLEFAASIASWKVYRTCVYMWELMKLSDNAELVLRSTFGYRQPTYVQLGGP